MEYIVDIFTNKKRWWMRKYDCKEVNGKFGTYYRVVTDHKTAKKICRKAAFRKIKSRCYSKQWERSNTYRKKFFDNYEAPYRCRYCNKRLNKDKTTVDHIIPVHQSKTNNFARNILAVQGITDVNDIRNLAPSCFKCNKRKDDHMGIWVIKGYLGKYKWFWFVRRIIQIIMALLIIYAIYKIRSNNFILPIDSF